MTRDGGTSRRLWWPRGRSGWILGAILLVTLIVRVGTVVHIWSVDPATTHLNDTPNYTKPALALERDGQFSIEPGSDLPMYFRTPGYPLFIAAVYTVAGEHDLAVLLAQIGLSVLTIWLAFVVASRLFGQGAGFAAALILALDPLQLWSAGVVLTETLMAAFMLLVAAIGFRVFARRSVGLGWPLLLGLVLAVATLVRPVAYYLLPLTAIALAVPAIRRRDLRPLAAAGMFLVPVVLLVGGWQLRNAHEVSSIRLSGVEGLNMYEYRGAGVLAEVEDRTFRSVNEQLHRRHPGHRWDHHQGPYFDMLFDEGLDIVTAHPGAAAVVTLEGLDDQVRQTGAEVFPTYFDLDVEGPATVLLGIALAVLWVAFVWGAVVALRTDRARRAGHLFALGIVAYTMLASAIPTTGYRFRVPIMPILALYAGAGVIDIWRTARARRSRSVPA